MTFSELLPALHALRRADKLLVIQLLAADMAREEGVEAGDVVRACPVWSPPDAFEGAATLLRVLDEERAAT